MVDPRWTRKPLEENKSLVPVYVSATTIMLREDVQQSVKVFSIGVSLEY